MVNVKIFSLTPLTNSCPSIRRIKMVNIKMHTGCSCQQCKSGRDKRERKLYHKKLRKKQKRQLKVLGYIKDYNLSIVYTD